MDLQFIAHPTGPVRLGDFLAEALTSKAWTEFRAAVAFVKRSGTKHIRDELRAFTESGGKARISAGIDAGGTSEEGLLDLVNAVNMRGQVFVFKNANASTFHPKVFLFTNENAAAVLVGSGNLTEGGLFTNYEASFLVRLDRHNANHATLLAAVEQALDVWSTPTEGLCYEIDEAFIHKLRKNGHLPDEAHARSIDDKKEGTKADEAEPPLFTWLSVPSAPKRAKAEHKVAELKHTYATGEGAESEDESTGEAKEAQDIPAPAPAQEGAHRIFLMTLQRTDVGVGQTTIGTSRRSPEIFIPLIARDFDARFWGWPDKFVSDPAWIGPVDAHGRGKMDRSNVLVRLGGDVFPVVFWYNPDKRDLRIRSEHLRSAGNIGDILYVERGDGSGGFSYYVDIIPQGSAKFAAEFASCNRDVRNSRKRWGYR